MRLYPSVSAALIAAVVAGLVALVIPAAARAQLAVDRETVQLNPSRTDERVAEFVVRNGGAAELRATVQLEDWDVDARGTSRWRRAGQVAGACGDRVTVSPSLLQLAPGDRQVVRVSVRGEARFDAECWSAAVVTPASTPARNAAAVAPASVPVYVTPNSAAIDGEVHDMFVKDDSIEVVFVNTGSVRAEIVGEVQVRMADDSLVLAQPLAQTTVLAGATRRFRIAMPTLTRGSYVLYGVVDYGGAALTVAQAALEIR